MQERTEVEAAAQLATETFDAFFAREYPGMVALAAAISGSRVMAEDLAQEAMMRAHREWNRISGFDKPGAWVRRVTINLATSTRRRMAAEARALLRLGPAPSEAFTAREVDDELWNAVRRLPRQQRAAVVLHYLEDRAVADIAEILECAESTAKVHLHRGRHSLAQSLRSGDRT